MIAYDPIGHKNWIKSLIDYRVDMILADTNTFIWIRHDKPEALKNPKLGGGNLLMVLGLFSSLNFLAKLYKILRKGRKSIINEKEIRELKDVLEVLPKRVRDLLQPKAVGQIRDEEGAFIKLITDSGSKFGLTSDELRKTWKSFRNYLSHTGTIYPGDSSVTFLVGKHNFEQFTDRLRRRDRTVFLKNKRGDRCYPDILTIEVQYIQEWLKKEVDLDRFSQENIEAVFDWVNEWGDTTEDD